MNRYHRLPRGLPLLLALLCWMSPALVAPVLAQSTPEQATAQRIAHTGKRGFLYLLTRQSQKFYLYGGASAANEDLFPFNQALLDALKDSQVLLVNHDPNVPASDAIGQAVLPADQSLSLLLSPIMLGLTHKALAAVNVDGQKLEHYKPWLVAETLIAENSARLGLDSNHATVAILAGFARNSGLRVDTLEPPDVEIMAANSMPMEVQIAWLAQVLADVNTDRGSQKFRADAEAWASGNEEQLQRARALHLLPPYSAYVNWYWGDFQPRHMQRLAEAAVQHLPTQGTALWAVPALDLPGQEGLLQQLSRLGWSVRNLQP